jgi:phosphatidylglycerol---prolipoprotein diacylglyceryl transferase
VPALQGVAALARTGHFRVPTGMAAYGGLIGGTVAGVLTLRRLRQPVRPFLDAMAPAVGVGYFFARVGCFLAGCDYGVPSAAAWAVRFPRGSYAFRDHVAHGLIDPGAPASLPVHPTQLYLAFAGLLLFLALRLVPSHRDGRRFALLTLGYAALRSTIELWRGDANRGSVGPFSTSQLLAVLTVATVLVAWLVLRRREVVSSSGAAGSARGDA